ncbi:hypothetical protein SK128_024170 [Halocaridina rubra]|uniref:Decapping nuclease n=1 Tax=Halocaridina rubra TaxID=373956 RepID=A0AAN8WP18_HALRR
MKHCIILGTAEEKLYTNEEYRCVLTTSFAGNTLLFAPEIDCVDPGEYEEDFETPESIILVKCCRELSNDKNRFNHKRHKLRNLWLENMISGIPRSLMGFRDDDGVVHTIELLKTDELPEMCEVSNVCMAMFHLSTAFYYNRFYLLRLLL